MIPHQQVLLKQIMLHYHTISYHCASIIADCSNIGQPKNNIFYLISSLQRQHHHSTSLTTTESDRSIAARWIVKTVGEVLPTLLRFGSKVEPTRALQRRPARPARSRCGGGQRGRRGRRGRAACLSAGRSQQPLLQRAGVQNRKRDDWNECFD